MSLLPASIKRIESKTTEKRWRHCFTHCKSTGAFCCHGNKSFDPICPKTLCNLSPTPVMLQIKFDQDWPTSFRYIQAWKCGRWRTGDGPLVYCKLTLWTFSSGELKNEYLCLLSFCGITTIQGSRKDTLQLKSHYLLPRKWRRCNQYDRQSRDHKNVCKMSDTLKERRVLFSSIFELPCDKTNKMALRLGKTQISLGIRPVWSESLLSAWRKFGSLATHWAHSEDSDQTGRMPRLIRVFTRHTVILLVLSWGSSFHDLYS